MWHGLEARSKAHYFLAIRPCVRSNILKQSAVDRRRSDSSGDFSQVLPHCRVFEIVLAACALLRQASGIDARGSVQYPRSAIQNCFFRLWEFR
jgi:hypothetical protein